MNLDSDILHSPIIGVLGGLVIMIMGVVWLYRELKFRGICVETEGTIIEWVKKSDVDGGIDYYAVFGFVDPRTGENITKRNPARGGNYRVGEQVKIIFDPNNSTHAEIKGSRSGRLLGLLLWILFSAIFVWINFLITKSSP